MVDAPSDVALMERVALGHPDALRALHDRYGRIAFALACLVVGETSTAPPIRKPILIAPLKEITDAS